MTNPVEQAECAARGCKERVFVLRKTGEAQDFCLAHWRKLTPTQRRAWQADMREDVLEWLEGKDVMIQQAYRYELDPTPEQRRWLNLHCRQHRVCFNYAWQILDAWWNENKERERKDRVAMPTDMYTRFNLELRSMPHMEWTSACVANARSAAFSDAEVAFRNFMRRLAKRAAGEDVAPGYPRRKRREDSNRFALQPASGPATLTWPSTHLGSHVGADGRAYPEIRLPKCPSWRDGVPGWIRLRERPDLKGRILKLAFESRPGKRPGRERWWVMCMVEREPKAKLDKRLPGSVIGLDLGINAVLTLSRPYLEADAPAFLSEDGRTVVPPRPLQEALRRKRLLAHRVSRRGSVYYRRKMLDLRERTAGGTQSVTIKAWKSRSNEGPFVAVRKLATRLGHIEVDGDDVRMTAFGLLQMESYETYTYIAKGEERLGVRPSRGYEAAQRDLAELDMEIANRRRDHLSKVSTWLVRTYETIVCEGFDVRGLTAEVGFRERRREIADLAWGDLRTRVAYKTQWYGGRYIQLPAHEPTNRGCSKCGTVNDDMPPMATRFRCANPLCRFSEKRQINTALYCEGFGWVTDPPESTGEGPPETHAPGDRQRRSKSRPRAEGKENGRERSRKRPEKAPTSPNRGVRPAGDPPAGGPPFTDGEETQRSA